MSIAIIVGNPKPQSRTLKVAQVVADAVANATADDERQVIDLGGVGAGLLELSDPHVAQLLIDVASSDLLIVASPTYKATFTGLLKVFLDRYGNNGLAGTVAIPVMTGAGPIHALAPEVHLRPLLVELGASVPTRGLYITEDKFDNLPVAMADWAKTAVPILKAALS